MMMEMEPLLGTRLFTMIAQLAGIALVMLKPMATHSIGVSITITSMVQRTITVPQQLAALQIAPDLLITAKQKHAAIPIHAPQGVRAMEKIKLLIQVHLAP